MLSIAPATLLLGWNFSTLRLSCIHYSRVHERVLQRLFGVSLALSAEQPLDKAERERCQAEMHRALADLRRALERPLAPLPLRTSVCLPWPDYYQHLMWLKGRHYQLFMCPQRPRKEAPLPRCRLTNI